MTRGQGISFVFWFLLGLPLILVGLTVGLVYGMVECGWATAREFEHWMMNDGR